MKDQGAPRGVRASCARRAFPLCLLLLCASARADLGPKPTEDFRLVLSSGGLPIQGECALLQCAKPDCSDARPLGQVGPQHFSCQADSCSALARKSLDRKLKLRLLLSVLGANVLSLPVLWFVLPVFVRSMLVQELSVWLFEAGFLYALNRQALSLRAALGLSLAMNLASAFCDLVMLFFFLRGPGGYQGVGL